LVAARHGTGTAPVLLTAFAVALTRVTGDGPAVTRVLTSNRFRSGLAGTVSPVSQAGLCVVDVAGATFDEAVTRTRRRALAAYKHAYYDPVQLAELLDRVGVERGEPIDIACLYNDRRALDREPDGPLPAPRDVTAALPRTVLHWADPVPKLNEKLLININDEPDTVDIWALLDTHHISPADLEALLQGMEDAVVEAAVGT
jgi:non-ribosomal peptide synthetase component F